MELLPEFEPPFAPALDRQGLTPDQSEVSASIAKHLDRMRSSAMSLNGSVALFQFAREHRAPGVMREWLFIAARDGAMSLRNYVDALARSRGLLGQIPPWLKLIDTSTLKAMEIEFREKFPFADKMRHSVAHPELYADPKKKDMAVRGGMNAFGFNVAPTASIVLHNGLSGYTFHSTFEGTLVHYDVTADTALAVVNNLKKCFNAFSAVDRFAQIPEF